jgi:predicted NBD/HSP70 family sugar kinase
MGVSVRGRRPALLYVRAHDRLAVAVDVRFSQTQVMLADFSGRALAVETLRTPSAPAELIEELAGRIPRMLQVHGRAGECQGVGVVVPGMVDPETSRLINAPALGWRDVDLREPLAAALDMPVYVERDAVACAQARMWLGRRDGEGCDSFAYVTVSDGIGAGFVVGGRVIRGRNGGAGELGHLPLSLEGPACVCGARGCLEAYASNLATVARFLGRELSTRESYAEIRETRVAVTDVIARARSGDGAARAALEASARYLGTGLAAVVNALNPARIVVGGEFVAAWDMVGDSVRAAMEERTLMQPSGAGTALVPEPVDEQTRLRGAAALVIAPMFAAPAVA